MPMFTRGCAVLLLIFAIVNSTGLVTTVAIGPKTASITAAFQGLSASFQLTLKGCGIIVPFCP